MCFLYILWKRKFFMDKKLLQALDHIGDGLELLVEALNSKEEAQSSAGAALQGGDFGKQLENINAGIKSIKADTKEIINNQQTIIALSKKKEDDKKTEEFEGASDPKKESAIKKGVATILLIAVAVLAIGMAFKLVGDVDFLSVVGLALAITIVSIAFEKVAKLDLTIKQAFITSLVLVTIATAITMSSWIMQFITPVGILQLLTAVAIAGVFFVIGKSMQEIALGVDLFWFVLGKKSAWVAPLVLVAIATALTASSWVFQWIRPVGFLQMLTAIGIAATFAIIGYSLQEIAIGISIFHKVLGKKSAWVAPLVLVAIATAITASSWIMQLITPVSFWQSLTAIMISLTFMLIGFALEDIAIGVAIAHKVLKNKVAWLLPLVLVAIATAITLSSLIMQFIVPLGLGQIITMLLIAVLFVAISYFIDKLAAAIVLVDKTIGVAKMFLIPLFFVTIATAIMVSSLILAETADISFILLIKILAIGLILAGVGLVIGPAAFLLAKLGIVNIIKGALALVILAATIMVSSLLLSLGDYETFPSFEWVGSVTLALALFGAGAALLGLLVFGPQALLFLAGIGAMVGLAGTILAVSKILAKGDYNLPGFLDWAKGTALLFATFTPILLILGAVGLANAVISFFGPNPFEIAKDMILQIASTIVAVSYILAAGNYVEGPSEDWAKGVSIALGAFSKVYDMLVDSQSLFGGGPSPSEFTTAILTVTWGIVTSANMLANASAAFENGPPYEWSLGVGQAIGAFAPVFDILAQSESFWGGPSPDDFAEAIMTVCRGIVDAAWFFANNTAPFDEGNYPSVEWGIGVGAAIGAFSQVFDIMASEGGGWFGDDMDEIAYQLATGVRYIAGSIVDAGYIFANASDIDWNSSYPSTDWAAGVSSAIGAFSGVFQIMVEQSSGWFSDDMDEIAGQLARGVRYIAGSIADAGYYMSRAGEEGWKAFPSKDWGTGVKNAISSFLDIFNMIWKSGISTKLFSQLASRVNDAVWYMADTARTLYKSRKYFTVNLDPKFVDNIKPNISKFIDLAKYVDSQLTTEVEVTDYSWYGSKSTRKVKVDRSADLLGKVTIVANAMASTAGILWWNRKFFNFKIKPDWIRSTRKSLAGFVNLAVDIDKHFSEHDDISSYRYNWQYMDGEYYTNSRRVDRVLWSMINTARIIGANAKYFNKKINPNFMRDVGQNILDFNEIVRMLKESESESGSFFGRLGDSIEQMIGNDPITQIAKRMVTLAKGYDAIATSLIKLGKALETLNIQNTKELPFLGKGSILRKLKGEDEEDSTSPKVSAPAPRKMESVGGEQMKLMPGVGLRAKDDKSNIPQETLNTMNKMLESLKNISFHMKEQTELLEEIRGVSDEQLEESKNKDKEK